METSERVLELGGKMEDIGRKGMKICGIGFPILLGVFLIAHFIFGGGFETFAMAFVFDFYMAYGAQIIAVILIYLCIPLFLVFLAVYLKGVTILGIGQTAVNTSKILLRLEEKEQKEG